MLPFILRGVALLGIDSVEAPDRAAPRGAGSGSRRDWRPAGLEEAIAREVALDGIEPVLDALLAGEAVGRTVVTL